MRWSVQSVLRLVRPIICTVSSQDESHSHSSSRSGGKANHQSRSHHWLCHYRQDSITMVLLPVIVRTVLSWFFFPLSSGQYYHGFSSHYRQDSITMVLLPIIVIDIFITVFLLIYFVPSPHPSLLPRRSS